MDAVALLVLSLEEPVDEARCYPYRIAVLPVDGRQRRRPAGPHRRVRAGRLRRVRRPAAFDGGGLVEPAGRRRRHHRGRRDPAPGHLCAGSGRGRVVLSIGRPGPHHRRRHRGRRPPGRDRLAGDRRRRRRPPPRGGFRRARVRVPDRHVRAPADRAAHAALRLGGRCRGSRDAAEAGRRDHPGALGDRRSGPHRGPRPGGDDHRRRPDRGRGVLLRMGRRGRVRGRVEDVVARRDRQRRCAGGRDPGGRSRRRRRRRRLHPRGGSGSGRRRRRLPAGMEVRSS